MNQSNEILINSNISIPSFTEDAFPSRWLMTRNERYCLITLLEKIRPKVAIEIGVKNGGSLQVISKYADKVYALDIDASIRDVLAEKYSNVEFIIGDSKVTLPQVIQKIEQNNESLEFALIDGDHSVQGVKRDIENIINHVPKTRLSVLLHDSFNPTCRKGMRTVNYLNNKFVHYVELDFISGIFEPDHLKNQMWGGLGLIVVQHEQREHDIIVHQCQEKLYNIAYKRSAHFLEDKFPMLNGIIRFSKKVLKFTAIRINRISNK